MGWPRKDEGARLYRLPGNDYRLFFAHEGVDPNTGEHNPKLVGTFTGQLLHVRWSKTKEKMTMSLRKVPRTYGGKAKRISWNELPSSWQQYLKGMFEQSPDSYRGLFRTGETYNEQTEIALD